MESQGGGRIITFYSYKGGTGRSMALANVAWVLATNRKRVLIIDWDLEAPGLHRYFRPFLIDKYLTSSDGLIDFVMAYADQVIRPSHETLPEDWFFPYTDISQYALAIDSPDFPEPGRIDLVPAGRQGATYATRVSSFDWHNFYDRLGGGAFFEAVRKRLREEYDYILIDSRTGVSDTSGICTVQMPDTLAVCFTYNNQSIEGASAIARSARDARRQFRETSSAFEIFPIPTRVEQAEQHKLRTRQKYARGVFDELLAPNIQREAYWQAVEIPYVPYYGYEETLAPFADSPNDPKSLLGSIIRITTYLTGSHLPNSEQINFSFPISEDESRQIRQEFAATPDSDGEEEGVALASGETATEEKVRQAESFFAHLSVILQAQVKLLLPRFVRVARREDGGEHSRQRLRTNELEDHDREAYVALLQAGLVRVNRDTPLGEETAELTDDAFVRNWSRLREWLEQDYDFLLWRQKLRDQLREWERNDHKSGFLLQGEHLREAVKWLNQSGINLNKDEKEFINLSSKSDYDPRSQPVRGGSRVFIIRPFGKKKDHKGNEIDFDQVASRLIDPALEALGAGGRETLDIVASGNIRVDMFRRLLTADLVIADLSIHHANVFYELGIRHALRERSTFLMRYDSDSFPFDLQSDATFLYDRDTPGASVPKLVEALRLKLDSTAIDSPVFLSLPNLHEPDPATLVTIPSDFREEVNRAAAQRQPGDLALLSHEVKGFEWEVRGLRAIGTAQFEMRAMLGAKVTWENVRKLDPLDLEANIRLGTVYERLGDLTSSTTALERALQNKDIETFKRAEVYALLGRNAKTRWRQTWQDQPYEIRRSQALRSTYLQEAINAYYDAFNEDLNHFYSGLNALALLSIKIELIKELPDVWDEAFDEDGEATQRFAALQQQANDLTVLVVQSLQATTRQLQRTENKDIWVEVSAADLRLLSSKRPARVAASYRDVLANAPGFVLDSVQRQLTIYRDLAVFKANVDAVFEVIQELGHSDVDTPSTTPQDGRTLLFLGHMIDSADRPTPRFPAHLESLVRSKLRDAVLNEINRGGAVAAAYAGGASGGDILFHEVCAELGIRTNLYLAFPPQHYVTTSVAPAGPEWVSRFWALYQQHQLKDRVRILSDEPDEWEALPQWLRYKPDYSIWARNNLWLFFNAFGENAAENVTFITLWDGARDSHPGSISDVIDKIEANGARSIMIHTKSLLDADSQL